MKSKYEEVEVRFLEVNVEQLVDRLKALEAQDLGEDLLREVIFYDKDLQWKKENKRVRLREKAGEVFVTFKDTTIPDSSRVKEIEFKSNDWESTLFFLESIGLVAARKQEKKRHTFILKDVVIDIDTWPGIPAYAEIESENEARLQETAMLLNIDWKKVVRQGAGYVLKHYYNIPIFDLQEFTFDRVA